MAEARGLYLKPPEKLPSTGVTKVTFKVFLNQLVAFLEQDTVNYMFLKDGCYSNWSAKQLGKRITDVSDLDKEDIRLKKELASKVLDQDGYATAREKLLEVRNSQVAKFIQLIAVLCYYTEQDDIDQCSTSFAWITRYLEKHYNIESRGVHFLDIASLTYKKGTPHQTFFKQFRALFLDNLRKKDDLLEWKNNEKLAADEKMTPTLEATIVLWALERIDPRLPVKVQKMYGHQMVGNKCLVTLQPVIFQNIPGMLQELEETDIKSSAHGVGVGDDGQLNAGWVNRGREPRRERGRSAYRSGSQNGRGNQFRGRGTKNERTYSRKFCRLCYHARSPQSTYQNHTISECERLTRADKTDLRAVLGAGEAELEYDEVEDRFEAYDAPGWDVQEDETGIVPKKINNSSSYIDVNSSALMINLNTIIPIPSQMLITTFNSRPLKVTLDSGATLSFIRLDVIIRLGIKMSPNGQLATLADEETRMASKGEIDIESSIEGIRLRLRALVMVKLQADCFGGTNFHKDNLIVSNINEGTVTMHNRFKIHQSNPLLKIQSYPPSRLTDETRAETWSISTDKEDTPSAMQNRLQVVPDRTVDASKCDTEGMKARTVNVHQKQLALPGEQIRIPLPESTATLNRIAIVPKFQGMQTREWPPQMCEIVSGEAVYLNNSRLPISHPKHAHFKTLPAVETSTSVSGDMRSSKALDIGQSPASVESYIRDIKINEKSLSKTQLSTTQGDSTPALGSKKIQNLLH